MAKAEIIQAWHNRLHSIISTLDHSSAANPGRILKADANGLPIESANTDAELADAVAKRHIQNTDTNLGAVGIKNPPIDADKLLYRDSTAGDALVTSTWTQVKAFLKTYFDTLYGAIALAHNRLHSITSILDHTSGATPGRILKADANGLPVDATNTDAQVAAAVGLAHTQGTDTALGAVGVKNPPIDADKSLYRDSTAGDALVTSTWAQIKAFFKTYFDTLYRLATADHTHQSTGAQAGKLDHGLALDGLSDDDHPQYIKHSLATAISDFLVASGAGVFVKKTLAEVKTLLNWAADIATHAALTATHGVAGTIAGLADIVSYIATHAGLTTGVHGVGASTIASVANIATHAALTTGVHSFDKTCRLWNNAVQSIPNATATAVTFNTEKWDTDEMHSTVSNTHLIVCKTAGKYLALASVEFLNNATGNRQVYIYKNTTALQIYAIDWAPRSDAYTLLTVFCFVDMAVNDTLQLKVYQTSGASLNIMSTDPYVPQLAVSRVA